MSPTKDVGHERSSPGALADMIESCSEEVIDRWMSRLQAQVGFGHSPAQLRDAMPDYLNRLADTLRTGPPSFRDSGARIWADVAREHALTRVRLGFDIEQLVQEFILLRQALSEVASEREIPFDGPESNRIADLVEAAIAVAVRSYVEARDYDARRKEAEHISFITHELRNPLTAVRLSATQLRRATASGETRLWDVLDRNVDRLAALIDSVLHAERLESGAIEAHVVEKHLDELLSPLIASAKIAADAKGLALHVEYDPELLVNVDPGLTASAVSNLLDNAVKYTDAGEVRVVAEPALREVTLHVWDNCPGISEQELLIIFQPFERGRTKKPGAGLGLAIARRAVEAQGGAIGAESPGERGCHFWMTMRRASH